MRAEYPEANLDHGVHIVSLHDELVSGIDSLLFLLMGVVGIVVLIATVNLANLLVARASSREEEIAVRRAIGATPARRARQMLTESVVLAMLGGAAGLGSSDGELWYPPATVVGVVGDPGWPPQLIIAAVPINRTPPEQTPRCLTMKCRELLYGQLTNSIVRLNEAATVF